MFNHQNIDSGLFLNSHISIGGEFIVFLSCFSNCTIHYIPVSSYPSYLSIHPSIHPIHSFIHPFPSFPSHPCLKSSHLFIYHHSFNTLSFVLFAQHNICFSSFIWLQFTIYITHPLPLFHLFIHLLSRTIYYILLSWLPSL